MQQRLNGSPFKLFFIQIMPSQTILSLQIFVVILVNLGAILYAISPVLNSPWNSPFLATYLKTN